MHGTCAWHTLSQTKRGIDYFVHLSLLGQMHPYELEDCEKFHPQWRYFWSELGLSTYARMTHAVGNASFLNYDFCFILVLDPLCAS